ncbi:MAG: rhodanese family protein, partial [Elusimicrobia bacterium]
MPKTVTVQELKAVAEADPKTQIIDVRESAEAAADGLAPKAVLAPLSNDVAAAGLLDPRKPLFVLCRSGARAVKAAALLEARGFTDVRVVGGGMEAWFAAGYPVERKGPSTWSLERQVRFTVSMLLLGSFFLGRWAHPGFLVLIPLVAAGLLYSSLTDTCGMALALARLP